MKIPPLPFTVTDWSAVAPTVHPGETGEAIWRTFTIGDLRVRQVEYTPGYLADHWCDLGHVLYVLRLCENPGSQIARRKSFSISAI